MKRASVILSVFLLLLTSCAMENPISLGNIGEKIDIMVLSPNDVMISSESDFGLEVTDIPLEYGKSYNLFDSDVEDGLTPLLRSITDWTDSNEKKWTIYRDLKANTRYTINKLGPFDTKDETPFLYMADTGFAFTTCKENQSPFLKDEDMRVELHSRKAYYWDYILIDEVVVTYFSIVFPECVLPNGDFISLEDPKLIASLSPDMSEPIVTWETEDKIEGGSRKILYRCPVLDNGKYYFELRCKMNINSSNEEYCADIGEFIFNLNSLDLSGE